MKHNPFPAAALAAVLAVAAAANVNAQPTTAIPGYTMGQKSLAKAPFTLADLESLKQTRLLTDEDIRYLSALTIPVTATLKPFLAKKAASAAEVEQMHAAWLKSELMPFIPGSHPYIRDGQS